MQTLKMVTPKTVFLTYTTSKHKSSFLWDLGRALNWLCDMPHQWDASHWKPELLQKKSFFITEGFVGTLECQNAMSLCSELYLQRMNWLKSHVGHHLFPHHSPYVYQHLCQRAGSYYLIVLINTLWRKCEKKWEHFTVGSHRCFQRVNLVRR